MKQTIDNDDNSKYIKTKIKKFNDSIIRNFHKYRTNVFQ